jgi:carbon storage regulator
MLVLNRKLDERIVIGESIVVTVISVGRGRVRLGIEAPSHIPVLRHELRERHQLCAAHRATPMHH